MDGILNLRRVGFIRKGVVVGRPHCEWSFSPQAYIAPPAVHASAWFEEDERDIIEEIVVKLEFEEPSLSLSSEGLEAKGGSSLKVELIASPCVSPKPRIPFTPLPHENSDMFRLILIRDQY